MSIIIETALKDNLGHHDCQVQKHSFALACITLHAHTALKKTPDIRHVSLSFHIVCVYVCVSVCTGYNF